jgi:hypothetical protein
LRLPPLGGTPLLALPSITLLLYLFISASVKCGLFLALVLLELELLGLLGLFGLFLALLGEGIVHYNYILIKNII